MKVEELDEKVGLRLRDAWEFEVKYPGQGDAEGEIPEIVEDVIESSGLYAFLVDMAYMRLEDWQEEEAEAKDSKGKRE